MIDVKNMTAAEKVLVMETIWESMRYNEEDIESPAWHEKILAHRKKRRAKGESTPMSLKELRDRLGR